MKAKTSFLISMLIFGTIGCFRRAIFLPSGMLAMLRGLGGALFLLVIMKTKKQSFCWERLKPKLPLVVMSGVFLGLNWILLFEAYITTTVAIATLSYYMAPILVILYVVLIKEEKMTKKKLNMAIMASSCVIMLCINIFALKFSSIALMLCAGAVSLSIFLATAKKGGDRA